MIFPTFPRPSIRERNKERKILEKERNGGRGIVNQGSREDENDEVTKKGKKNNNLEEFRDGQ